MMMMMSVHCMCAGQLNELRMGTHFYNIFLLLKKKKKIYFTAQLYEFYFYKHTNIYVHSYRYHSLGSTCKNLQMLRACVWQVFIYPPAPPPRLDEISNVSTLCVCLCIKMSGPVRSLPICDCYDDDDDKHYIL